MNITYRLYIVAALVVALAFVGWRLYNSGWDNGRAALVAEQQAKALAQLAKQTTRQQANDSKAASADDEGTAKTVTITQEVIRYVKTPGRNVCTFDTDRLSIKSAAVDNANTIPGYDDAAVQAPAAVGQR